MGLHDNGSISVAGHEIEASSIQLLRQFKGDTSVYESAPSSDGKLLLCLNITEDEELAFEGIARQVLNRIQKLRKEESLSIHDKINFFIEVGVAPESDAFKDYETASKAMSTETASASVATTADVTDAKAAKANKKAKAKAAKAAKEGKASAGASTGAVAVAVGVTAALPTPPSAAAVAKAAKASVAAGETLMRAIEQNSATMMETLKTELFPRELCPEHAVVVAESIETIGAATFRLVLTRQAPCFPPLDVFMTALQLSGAEGEKRAVGLMTLVASMKYDLLVESESGGLPLEVELEGVTTALTSGVHFSAKMKRW
jgi:cell wall-associated NlpC family hydrolase